MFKNLIFHHWHFFLRSVSRIRIRIWNPHLECGFRMRIHADADPQHWMWHKALCNQQDLVG
jgi:hypothetical protein